MPDATALSRLLTSAGLVDFSIAEEGLGSVLRLSGADTALPALRALHGAGYAMMVDLLVADLGEESGESADAGDGGERERPVRALGAPAPLEITWHLRSFAVDEDLFVKARVAYGAEVSSAWTVYPAALYPEREAAELFGMSFAGHPNPKRLLTTDEVGYLLRKSTPIRTYDELARPGIRRKADAGRCEA